MYITKVSERYDPATISYIYSGELDGGATFTATRTGPGGNNATYRIVIEGGQFDHLEMTVMGEWEIMQLLEIMKLITPQV
jgi:hypothetical protein